MPTNKQKLPEVVYLETQSLKINPDNPRQITRAKMEKLKKSLGERVERFAIAGLGGGCAGV